jgi:hypothetical protein
MSPDRDGNSEGEKPAITFESPGIYPIRNPGAQHSSHLQRPLSHQSARSLESGHSGLSATGHVLHMLLSARRSICIYSHSLDPRLYDSDECQEACARLLTGQHRSRLRILVADPKRTDPNHKLVKLAQRLTSNCAVRKTQPEHIALDDTEYLLVDDAMLFLRPKGLLSGGQAFYNDRSRVRTIQRRFDLSWDFSLDVPNLRSHIL